MVVLQWSGPHEVCKAAFPLELTYGFGIQIPAEICTESNDMALVGTGPTASAIYVLAPVLLEVDAREVAGVTTSIFPLVWRRSLMISCCVLNESIVSGNCAEVEEIPAVLKMRDRMRVGPSPRSPSSLLLPKTVSPIRGVTTVCKAWLGTTPPITLDSA